jgi:phosphatidylethanolamine/phosphatidyl-N-methylethanolamine N-methyltransferase
MTAAEQTSQRDRTYWEQHARNYDRSLRLLAKPLPRMLELTSRAVAGAGRVLEVAAGTGLVTRALARSAQHVVATDYAAAMVAMLTQRTAEDGLANVTCERADLYALPYEAASFDAIVAANVLHLVPDLEGAILSLKRVLRPHGRLVVPTFCHDETLTSALVSRLLAITGFPGHRRFTTRSLAGALVGRGLQVEVQETLSGLIPIGFVQGSFG